MAHEPVARSNQHVDQPSDTPWRATSAWLATATTLVSYFALMFTVAVAPELLARPVGAAAIGTIGLIAGIGVIVVCIVVSAAYTMWRNRQGELP